MRAHRGNILHVVTISKEAVSFARERVRGSYLHKVKTFTYHCIVWEASLAKLCFNWIFPVVIKDAGGQHLARCHVFMRSRFVLHEMRFRAPYLHRVNASSFYTRCELGILLQRSKPRLSRGSSLVTLFPVCGGLNVPMSCMLLL